MVSEELLKIARKLHDLIKDHERSSAYLIIFIGNRINCAERYYNR